MLMLSLPLKAQPVPPPPINPDLPLSASHAAYLVTYGPGSVYWERFGHNAIWLEEPLIGLNHSFNFGFFDFNQESFLLRFLRGQMLYFAAALPAQREQRWYQEQQRSVRVQRLNLAPEQYLALRQHLLTHVQPENRDYPYDYYRDNCSTRLRDALDLALEGEISRYFSERTATATLRAHTRRSTVMDYWYYLGLEVFLGVPVDRPISRWEEMFLPAVLADALTEIELEGKGDLVLEDVIQATGAVALPPERTPLTWPRYLLAGFLAAMMLAVMWPLMRAKLFPEVLLQGFLLSLLLMAGTVGVLLFLLAAFTDHSVASPNLNLLVFNPLLVMVLWVGPRRVLLPVLLAGLGVAIVLGTLGIWQYNLDVLALFGPVLMLTYVFLITYDRRLVSTGPI